MKKALIIALFFVSFFGFCNAYNTQIDSLEKLVNSSVNLNEIAFWKLEICKIRHEQSAIDMSRHLGELHFLLNLIESDETYINICLFTGSVYRSSGQYDNALKYDFLGLKRAENYEDVKLEAKLLNNIGIDLYRSKNLKKSLEYYFLAEQKYLQVGDVFGTGDCYNNIGMAYDDLDKGDSALYYYDKAQDIFEKHNDKDAISDILNNKAGVYYKKGDFKTVLGLVMKSLEIQEGLGNEDKVAYTLINIGILYYSLGDYQKAIEFEERGLAIAEKNGNYPHLRVGYQSLAEAYAKKGDYKKAFLVHIKYAAANDTIFNQDMAQAISEMQTKYETEKIEQQLSLLEIEYKLADILINRGRIVISTFLIIIILGLIIALILIRQNKYKSRLNKVLESKNMELSSLNATKNKFFAIVSHDIKNPLSGFKAITSSLDESFHEMSEDDIKKHIKLLRKSSEQLSELLKGLLSWAALLSSNKELNIKEVQLSEIIHEIVNLVNDDCNSKGIELILNISELPKVYIDENMLLTIVRNIVSNAIKFTPSGGKIEISLYRDNDRNIVLIKDTGIGISQQNLDKLFRIDADTKTIGNSKEKGAGLGLILVKEMADRCNIEIDVKSELGKGTEFRLSIPT
ncbi:MAG: tetratricopeptide repeat-containing sensor histidine kinase [Dysgonamonadaceae bacterium]|nr:tetratricopeptide repeat-containing sensor histidine kinase [Dysgonamonadaceae bacterium]MDY0216504.1 tetratricopeptide repeat-containing sensor histidine kinase [Bacteroidales bacterium]